MCIIGFLFYYGLYSFMMWMAIYQFTNVTRIYLFRLPKIWIPIRFFIGYFTWSLWVNIIAIILNETEDKYYWTFFNSMPAYVQIIYFYNNFLTTLIE